MTISSIINLKKNEVFVALNHLQSQYDATDSQLLANQFTRSPLHAIQFLIAYAGLNDDQRTKVITQLQTSLINKMQMDTLVNDIDWVSILKTSSSSTLKFKFRIALASKVKFFSALHERCPNLYQALKSQDSIIDIDEADEISFISTISQTELWREPFDRDLEDSFWKVPVFNLSPALTEIVKNTAAGKNKTVGCFTIMKGIGRREILLHIEAPFRSNQFSIANEIELTPGIYDAFLGIRNFYGLPRVDKVEVKIQSKANFSDIGASTSQTQIVRDIYLGMPEPSRPTVILVNDLNVLFNGADIVANFTKGVKKTRHFDPKLYIELPTKSKENTSITLLAQAPNPRDAFLLVTPEAALLEPLPAKSSAFCPSICGLFHKKRDPMEERLIEPNRNSKNGWCCTIL